MDGSTASLIAIPIVVTLVLAAWLLLVAHAAAHPQWKHGPSAAEPHPADLTPADQTPAHAGQDAVADQPARLAA
jgi:hypothetical protein